MCAMCGVLGGSDHWADAHARPGVFTRTGSPLERRRERMRRVAFANAILVHFGLTLSDWQGTSFVLSTRTGKSAMVDSLAHLWVCAEALLGRPCDPLDPTVLGRLELSRD